ncbi:hypothetical protein GH714_044119 [Hevea brasiliensis]|uniref:Putative exodeoxyribonuclease 8 PDDEXK-like domain-containing protein n=1 Tax=Hevea brasiliensis TaxID=3981 RepID=A0A6A6K1N9_HEVBR|nr:hypothetical protein GH714_044119 [Hevea brasiliensis]
MTKVATSFTERTSQESKLKQLDSGIYVFDSGYRGTCPKEEIDQMAYGLWMEHRFPEVNFFHVPNETSTKSGVQLIIKRQKMGVKSGVHDNIILHRGIAWPYGTIELKRRDKTKCRVTWRYKDEEDEQSKALIFGTGSHTTLLEPEKFDAQFVRMPSKEEFGPDLLVTVPDMNSWAKERGIKGLSGKAKHELLLDTVKGGYSEVSIMGELNGELAKVRFDYLSPGADLVDYKTAVTAKPDEFFRHAARLGYFMKMAMQHDMFVAAYGKPPRSVNLLVQEKKSPFIPALIRLTEEQLRIGRIQLNSAMQLYKACKKAQAWPGYSMGNPAAERSGSRVVIGISGQSGSGKTYSALKLARGMVSSPEEIGFLDTENGRGRLYSNILDGKFMHADMYAPFSPARYRQAIEEFQKAGVKVLVIDSGSHEWEGEGGCTDIADQPLLNGKKMADWKRAKSEHKKFMSALLQSNMHIIVCLRARHKTDFSNPKDPMRLD